MKLSSLIVIIFLAATYTGSAQITFSEDPQVTALMDRYHKESTLDPSIEGWRIKLVSTTDRRRFESAKYQFQAEFPDANLITAYENPYYSIKVGAYESRYALEPFLLRFKQIFPDAIPFRDRIEKKELLKGL